MRARVIALAAVVLVAAGLAANPRAVSAATPALPPGCDAGTLETSAWICAGSEQNQSVLGVVGSTYTGDNPAALPPNVASDPFPVNTLKIDSAAQMYAGTTTELALNATSTTGTAPLNTCPEGGCPPPRLLTNAPLVPQETNYTCGPAVTRLVVWQITGVDNGEQTYTDYEGTRANYGTNIVGVEKGLNRDVPANERFGLIKPSNPTDLMNWVVNDVWKFNSSLVEEIDPAPLPFWHMQHAKHFNVIYGYDLTHSGILFLSEEFGGSYSWGSPYGFQQVTPSQSFAAIQGGWNQEIVA